MGGKRSFGVLHSTQPLRLSVKGRGKHEKIGPGTLITTAPYQGSCGSERFHVCNFSILPRGTPCVNLSGVSESPRPSTLVPEGPHGTVEAEEASSDKSAMSLSMPTNSKRSRGLELSIGGPTPVFQPQRKLEIQRHGYQPLNRRKSTMSLSMPKNSRRSVSGPGLRAGQYASLAVESDVALPGVRRGSTGPKRVSRLCPINTI